MTSVRMNDNRRCPAVRPAVRRLLPWSLGIGLVAASVLMACTLAMTKPTVRFSHQRHAAEGAGCADCHGTVASSTAIERGHHIPKERDCFGCHDESEGKKNCGLCHADGKKPVGWQVRPLPPAIRFSHASHMAKPGMDKKGCATCHQATIQATEPGSAAKQAWHATCMECHRNDFRQIGCERCHTDLVSRTDVPLTLFDHKGDFLKRHGSLARSDARVCEHCHRQDDCASCHSRLAPIALDRKMPEREELAMVHRHDFVARHSIEARADRKKCLTCHKTDDCSSCHLQRGVSALSGDATSPHPAGWMEPGSAVHHGHDARRQAALCASCHDRGAATNCIPCHRVGAGNKSPHAREPEGVFQRSSDVPCIYCHR